MLPASVFNRRAIAVSHLGPAGHTRLDAVPDVVERNLLLQLGDKARALRSRPDQAHLALKNTDELRQFVDAHLADECTDAGNARVVLGCPARHTVFFGIGAHAAELQAHERASAQTHTFLAIDDRARAFELDRQSGQHHHRRGDQDQQRRREQIKHALDQGTQPALHETVPIHQPAGLEAVGRDFTLGTLEEAGQVEHWNTADTAGQQLVHRHTAATLFAHCDDHFVDAVFLNHFVDRQSPGENRCGEGLGAGRRRVDRRRIETDDRPAR